MEAALRTVYELVSGQPMVRLVVVKGLVVWGVWGLMPAQTPPPLIPNPTSPHGDAPIPCCLPIQPQPTGPHRV